MKKLLFYLKLFVEWLLGLYIKIRPKKTFNSVIFPIVIFILGEILKYNDIGIRLLLSLSEKNQNSIISFILDFLISYLSINLPNFFLLIPIILFLVISYLRFLELSGKWKLESICLDKDGTSFLATFTDGKISFNERIKFRKIVKAIEERKEKSVNRLTKKIEDIEISEGLLNQRVLELSRKINDINQLEPNQKVVEFFENFQGKELINYSSLFLKSFNYIMRGKIAMALKVLNENEIEKMGKLKDKKHLYQLKARILRFSHDNEGAKIYYEKIYLLDDEDIDLLLENAYFLHIQKEYDMATNLYKRGLEIVDNSRQRGIILNNYGALNQDLNNLELSELQLLEALKIRKEICLRNSNSGNLNFLGDTYSNLGNLYAIMNDFERAIENYEKSLEIVNELYEIDSNRYGRILVSKLSDLGSQLNTNFRREEASEIYKKAIAIIDDLKDTELEVFQREKASLYNNMGSLKRGMGFIKEAQTFFNKSADIIKELVKVNSEANLAFLAITLQNQAKTEVLLQNYDMAKKYFEESLTIARNLVQHNKKANLSTLSHILYGIGRFEVISMNNNSGVKYIEEAIELEHILIKVNPNRHLKKHAESLNLLSFVQLNFYGNYNSAMDILKGALDIFVFLSKESPILHGINVCKMNINLSNIYKHAFEKTKNYSYKEKTIKYFNEAKSAIDVYTNNTIADVDMCREILKKGVDFNNMNQLNYIA